MDIVEQLQEMPELTPAQYWEAQASMWHENYKEAADEIERLRIDLEVAEDRKAKAQLFQNDMLKEIERLRKALQLIAAPSKVVVKNEEAVVALQLLLSSHRRTALKALAEGE